MRGFSSRHQSTSIVLVVIVVTILLPIISLMPPFSGFGTQKDFVGGFAAAGVFVLLALGLNVVVGFAGLLDLGYAAFFAIGAYTYAYGASGFTGLSIPFWPMLLVGALVAAVFGVLLGAPTLRLRGDYLAIVTLGLRRDRARRVPQRRQVHERHQRHHRASRSPTLSACSGSTGSGSPTRGPTT